MQRIKRVFRLLLPTKFFKIHNALLLYLNGKYSDTESVNESIFNDILYISVMLMTIFMPMTVFLLITEFLTMTVFLSACLKGKFFPEGHNFNPNEGQDYIIIVEQFK